MWAKKRTRNGFINRLYRLTAAGVAHLMLLQTLYAGVGFAHTPTDIVPDGNTETHLHSNGTATDVHTGTVMGRTGLNSFQVFDVGSDSTVNLHVPTGAAHLVNLVHDRRSVIDGTLNSVMDGTIGGDVYFLNPYGVVVGQQGVVNVGSLTLLAPEHGFMRDFFTRPGGPDGEAVNRVLEGLVPISRDGLISVRGQVHAVGDVDIAGGSIEIGETGSVATGAAFVVQEPDLSDVLNIGGLAGTTRATAEAGGIRIVAAEDVTHGGVLSADGGVASEGGPSVDGGDVVVLAGGNIVLQDDSLISARGQGANSDGGNIVVFADREAVFHRGAAIDARGGDVSGDGGFIELSAVDTVRLEGGIFRAWATDGRAGRILIDPEHLEIVSDNQYTNGAEFRLQATGSITVNENIIISTRRVQNDHENGVSTGDSGHIILEAPRITIGQGARILAHADSGHEAGDIRFIATSSSANHLFPAIEHTSIVIDGATLKGRNISLLARSSARHDWNVREAFVGTLSEEAPDLLQNLVRQGADRVYDEVYEQIENVGEGLSEVGVGLAVADAQAKVHIGSGSKLLASGDIRLTAESTALARAIADDPKEAGRLGLVFGVLSSHADVLVSSGATVESHNLLLSATNIADLDLATISSSSEELPVAASFAVGVGVVGSSAIVERGANVRVRDDVAVIARNQSGLGVIAQAEGDEDAIVGSTGSLLVAYTDARAALDADVMAIGGDSVGSVGVHAIDVVQRSEVAAETVAASGGQGEDDEGNEGGGEQPGGGVDPEHDGEAASSSAWDLFLSKLKGLTGDDSDEGDGTSEEGDGDGQGGSVLAGGFAPDERSGLDGEQAEDLIVKLAGATSVAVAGHGASATIGDDVVIHSSGDVSVVALVDDGAQQARAVTGLDAEIKGDEGEQPFASAGALLFGFYRHDAVASIGKNSRITARNLGVKADVVRTGPTTLDWSGLGPVADRLKTGDNVTDGLLSSYAASGGASGADVALSGALSFLHYGSSASAYVDDGARIDLIEGEGPWTTETAAVHGDDPPEAGTAFEVEWDDQVTVAAGSTLVGAFGGGDALTGVAQEGEDGSGSGDGEGGNSGSGPSLSVALSGTYAQVNDINDTIAYIGEGVTIARAVADTAVDVGVIAQADRNLLLTTVGAGGGDTFGLNGNFALSVVKGVTEAHIDGSAIVDVGGDVRVDGRQRTVSLLAGGGTQRPSGANLSATLGIMAVDTVTRSFIGDHGTGPGGTMTANNVSVTTEAAHTVEAVTSETGNSAAVTFVYFDGQAEALLGKQPVYDVTGDVTVGAFNTNSFSLSAAVQAADGATAGIAAAVLAIGKSEATARSEANLTGVSNLNVTAVERIVKTSVLASTSVGSTSSGDGSGDGEGGRGEEGDQGEEGGEDGSAPAPELQNPSGTRGAAENLVSNHMANNAPESKDRDTEFTLPTIGGAVSFVHGSHSAEATIGGESEIDAAGSVAVVARSEQLGLQQKAETGVVSQGVKDGESGIPLAVSGAVVVGVYNHRADALIGAGSVVSAQNVGVGSDVVRDYNITWHKWEGISTLTSKFAQDLGVVDNLSAYANATGAPGKGDIGLTGSVVVMNFHNDSTATIGEGATISTKPGSNGAWQSPSLGAAEGEFISWDAPVSVQALTDLTGAYAAGDIDVALKGVGGDGARASIGGSYAQVNHFVTTKATIGKNVRIGAIAGGEAPDLALRALTEERSFVIVPSAGRGATYGVVGNAGLGWMESTTVAAIEDGDDDGQGTPKTELSVRDLNVVAEQTLLSFVVAGALMAGENAGMGVGISVQNVQSDTRATVGRSLITARNADIGARTDGVVESIAVAGGAAMSGGQSGGGKDGGSGGNWLSKASGAFGEASDLAEGLGDRATDLSPDKIEAAGEGLEESEDEDKSGRPEDLRPGPSVHADGTDSTEGQMGVLNGGGSNEGPKFGLGISGSVALNVVGLQTTADVSGATITLGGDVDADLSVIAVNDTDVGAFSGGASLVRANNPSNRFSAGVAGSAAVNVLTNTTKARIGESDISDARRVTVRGVSGGDQMAIALGLAINASSGQSDGGSGAGSVSVSIAENGVGAAIEHSTLTGLAATEARGGVEVLTYDRTRMATGGGSLLGGGKGGLGLALTYTGIHNTSDAVIAGSGVSRFDSVDVTSLNASLIAAGGAMGGGQTENDGGALGGAFVVSVIDNRTSARVEQASTITHVRDVGVTAQDVSALSDLTQGLDDIVDARGCTEGCTTDGFDVDFAGNSVRADGEMEAGASRATVDAEQAGDDAAAEADEEVNKADQEADGEGDGESGGSHVVRNGETDEKPEYPGPTDIADDASELPYMGGSGIVSVAGVVQGGGNNAGLSIAWNTIANDFEARITDSTVDATEDVDVSALSNATIIGAAVGVGAGNKFAGAGSLSVNHTINSVVAEISSSSDEASISAGSVTVRALDRSDISTLAGSVGFTAGSGGQAAAGAAIAFSGVNNTTGASVRGIDVAADGWLRVDGRNRSVLRTLALAGAATEGAAAVAGSFALSEIANSTSAEVTSTGDNEMTVGSLFVGAQDDAEMNALAGQVALAGKAAVGGAAAVNWIGNTTQATVAGVQVSASAGGNPGDGDGPVAVISDNTSRIRGLAVSGGFSENVAVGGSAVVSVVFNHTEAEVDASASVEGSELAVRAADDSRIYALGGQLSASGTAAVGGAAVLSHIFNTTRASLAAQTDIKGLAYVDALNKARIFALSASGGFAETAAVNGSLSFAFVGNKALARVKGNGNSVEAGTLVVAAKDESVIGGLSGALSGAGTAAVGGAATVSNIVNTARATVDETDVSGGALYIDAANEAMIVSAALAGQGGGNAGVGGSLTTNVIVNRTIGELRSGGSRVVTLNDALEVWSRDDSSIYTLAGSVSGGGTAGVGAGFTINNVTNTTQALVEDVEVAGTSRVKVDARSAARIVALAVSGQGGGNAAVGGTLAESHIFNQTLAQVRSTRGNTLQVDRLAVAATDRAELYTLSMQVAGAGTAAVGGAVALNLIGNETVALVDDVAVQADGDVDIDAENSSIIVGVAVSGGGAGNAAVGGSVVTSLINNRTLAELRGATQATVGKLSISGMDSSQINTLAGQVSAAGNASVGAAASVGEIGNDVAARIAGVDVDARGQVVLDATNDAVIRTAAATGGAAVNAAVRGADTTNIIVNETIAEICALGSCEGDDGQSGSSATPRIEAASLRVAAKDGTEIWSLAGQVGGSVNASVGGAVAHNQILNRTLGSVTDAAMYVDGETVVSADNASQIWTLSASGGLSVVGASVQGSISSSHVNNDTEARIVDSSAEGRGGHGKVLATDEVGIHSLSGAGGVNFGPGAGIGLAISVNQIGNKTTARLSGSAADSMYDVGALLVRGQSKANIRSVASGLGFAGEGAGIAGSTAIDLINNDTKATIDGGARVLAQENVGVVAWSDDVITNVAGGASLAALGAGVGGSATVSEVGGSTAASIEGEDTSVTALAQGAGMDVASGDLNKSLELESLADVADGLENFSPLQDLSSYRKVESVRGVAVNAAATHHIQNFGANGAAAAFAGVGGIMNVSVVAGSTEAFVKDANINSLIGGGSSAASQGLHIGASDHALAHGIIVSGAGGIAGVGGATNTTVFAQQTRAFIEGSERINAQDAVDVRANSTHNVASVVAGASGGIVGAAGSLNVAVFTGTTDAYIKDSGLRAGRVNVGALHTSRLFVSGGAAAAGGGGVAGAFVITVDEGTTRAYIDSSDVDVAEETEVHAETDTEIHTVAATAGAAGLSIAGSAVVSIVNNTTSSYVKNSRLGSADERSGPASVTAFDRVATKNIVGAAGTGMAGVGAVASVTYVGNATEAYVDGGSIYARGKFDVGALSERYLGAVAASGGLGGVGLSGALAAIFVGEALSGDDIMGDLDKGGAGTLSTLNELMLADRVVTEGEGKNIELAPDAVDPGDPDKPILPGPDFQAANTAGRIDIKDVLLGGEAGATTAIVSGGALVDVEGDVAVTAEVRDAAQVVAGGLVGGGLGAGAAIGAVVLANKVDAALVGGAQVRATGDVQLRGQAGAADTEDGLFHMCGDGNAARVCALQGALGGVTAGAAVGTAVVNNDVTARVGRGTGLTSSDFGLVSVIARDLADVYVNAEGYAGGGAAAGAVLGVALKQGSAIAQIADDDIGGSSMTISVAKGALGVMSNREGRVTARTVAGAGGVVAAGAGSGATATDEGDSQAYIGRRVNVNVADGSVVVHADARPQVEAESRGFAGSLVSGYGAGIGVATAAPKVRAEIATGGMVTARDLAVRAAVGLVEGADYNARSFAQAAGVGAAFAGITANTSTAQSASEAAAVLGAELNIGGDVTVAAQNSTEQFATAAGLALGGTLALGLNHAEARADSVTTATVGDSVRGVIGGTLSVVASGVDATFAEAAAGSGGLYAGNAAMANTSNVSHTLAELGSSPAEGITADLIDVNATHSAQFDGKVDTLTAAVVGASGAGSAHTVDGLVQANIRDDAVLAAADMSVLANNITRKTGVGGGGPAWSLGGNFNVQSGSGGVYSGAAADSTAHVAHATAVSIGDNALLRIGAGSKEAGRTQFLAINDVLVRDKVKLDAGAVIAGAFALSTADIDVAARTSMGRNVDLDSDADVTLGTLTLADVHTSANTKTYGGASAAAGKSASEITINEAVDVLSGAKIRSGGDINLFAGRDASGVTNEVEAIARTDLYNKSAVPIPGNPEADAMSNRTAVVTVGSGAALRSVGDVNLLTRNGYMLTDGFGQGTDLYREMASELVEAAGKAFAEGDAPLALKGGKSVSEERVGVTVDGLLQAGIQSKQRLIIDVDGNVVEATDGVGYSLSTENLLTNLSERRDRLYALLAAYDADPDAKAAFQAEINHIEGEIERLGYGPGHRDGEGYIADEVLVDFMTVDDVVSMGGNINVTGDYFVGTGDLDAAGEVELTIVNNSPLFLRTKRLVLDDRGGFINFNNSAVADLEQINERNMPQTPGGEAPKARFNAISAIGSSGVNPGLIVKNTFVPIPGQQRAPDIEITGNVTNRRGTVTIDNAHGSIRLQSDSGAAPNISALTVELLAPRGTIMQSYVDGFVHVGGDPRDLWEYVALEHESGWGLQQQLEAARWYLQRAEENCDSPWGSIFNERACDEAESLRGRVAAMEAAIAGMAVPQGKGSWIAGNDVFISARYLNINGTIQSGIPDWELTLTASDEIKIAESRAKWLAAGKPADALYQLTGFAEDPTGRIVAFYNPTTNEIVLEGIEIRGGRVELFGEIMNTGGGKINVMDGYGRVNIHSDLPYDIVVNGLDAGSASAGLLRITDTAYRVDERPITTEYRRLNGLVDVRQYLAPTADLPEVELGHTTGGARDAVYTPAEDLRYVWVRGRDFSREWIGKKESDQWFVLFPGGEEQYDSYTETANGQARDMPDGVYVDQRGQEDPYTYSSRTVSTERKRVSHKTWSTCDWPGYIGTFCPFKETHYVEDIYRQGTQEIYTHSVKADYPISIHFIGLDAGDSRSLVNVNVGGNLILAGSVANVGGRVVLDAGRSITQTTDKVFVHGTNIELRAQTGIGSGGQALQTVTEGTGSLVATSARDDVFIANPRGDLRIGLVEAAGGDVNLTADRHIVQEASGNAPVIVGGRIHLQSNVGSVGDAAQPLNLKAGTETAHGLSVSAPGDIFVRQTDGDFHLVEVHSSGGDVYVEAANGSLVDASPNEKRDERTIAQLLDLWDDMMLLGEEAEASAQATLDAYVRARQSEYQLYWALRGVEPIFDEFDNIVGYTVGEFDPHSIDGDFAIDTEQLQRLHDTYGEFGYDPDFQYVLSEQERDELTEGSAWTEQQLTLTLGPGILFKQTTSTETRIEDPNVIGRNVTLVAHSGSVGTDTGAIVFDRDDPHALQDERVRLALAAAEPDDIAVDLEANTVTILLRDSLDVAAAGELVVDARDHVYIGSRVPMYVKTVESGGSIRIKGSDGLYSVATSGEVAIQGDRLILEAGDGGIGTADNPIAVKLRDGAGLTARAAESIFIRELYGNLNIASVYSTSGVFLAAKDSILHWGDSPVTIEGAGINLAAEQGSVGTIGNALRIVLAPGSQVTAQADAEDQGVYLHGIDHPLNVGDVSAGSAIRLSSADSLLIHGLLTAKDDVDLEAAYIEQRGGGGGVRTFDLSARGVTGINLNGDNDVRTFTADNSGGGDVLFNNASGELLLGNVRQADGGNILVTNRGNLVVDGLLITIDDVLLDNDGDMAMHGDILSDGVITMDNSGALYVGGSIEGAQRVYVANASSLTLDGIVENAGSVELLASGGITQTGGRLSDIGTLTLSSVGGQMLGGTNAVRTFVSDNAGGGDIILDNTFDGLILAGVRQHDGGDIVVANVGDMEISEELSTANDILVNNSGSLLVTGMVSTPGSLSIDTTGHVILNGVLQNATTAGVAAGGSIDQADSGRLMNIGTLTLSSVGGQTLLGDNTVRTYIATNSGGGAIKLNNTFNGLTLAGVRQHDSGDIVVTNVGDMEITHDLSTAGDITIDNDGDLSVSGTVSTPGNVTIDNVHRVTMSGAIENAATVQMMATGRIGQVDDGRFMDIGMLTLSSVGGQMLLGDNAVREFVADNRSGGAIEVNNAIDGVTLAGVRQHDGGDIVVSNVGDMEITDELSTVGGNITIDNVGNVTMGGAIENASTVRMTADGRIGQVDGGRFTHIGMLTLSSVGGQMLRGDNTVGTFVADNWSGGAIEFNNAFHGVTLAGVRQHDGGDIAVTNVGDMEIMVELSTADTITIDNIGNVTMSGAIENASTVRMTADGRIEQLGNGRLTDIGTLTLSSVGGQTLLGDNTVREFVADNSGGGAIKFNNTFHGLTLKVVQQRDGGDIVVTNVGHMEITDELSTVGNIVIDNVGNVTMSGAIENASTVRMTVDGRIGQVDGGRLTDIGMLTLSSVGGQTLLGDNTVGTFVAGNSGGGAIKFNNTFSGVMLKGVRQHDGGDVVVANVGDMEIAEALSTTDNITIGNVGNVAISGVVEKATVVKMVADGRIEQVAGGRFTDIGTLTLSSVGGQMLIGDNILRTFIADNAGGGAIKFNNSFNGLTLKGVEQHDGGDIVVINVGDMEITEELSTVDHIAIDNDGDLLVSGTISTPGSVTIDTVRNVKISGAVENAATVKMTAAGRIGQVEDGRLTNIDTWTLSSVGGQTLLGDNIVGTFVADNRDGGAIEINNAFDGVTLASVRQHDGGDIVVANVGGMEVTEEISTVGRIAIDNDGRLLVSGTIRTPGSVAIDNAGDVTLSGALENAGQVTVAAGGRIEENGGGRLSNVGMLTLLSSAGQTLLGDNTVGTLVADNSDGGAIKFNNTFNGFTLAGVRQHDEGDIVVANVGDMEIADELSAVGDIRIANEGHVVMSGVVATRGDVTVEARGMLTQVGAGRVEDGAGLTVVTAGGLTLTGANTVHSIVARNDGGDIFINNARNVLALTEVRQLDAGNVSVENEGSVTLDTIVLPEGTLTLAATDAIVNGHSSEGHPEQVNIAATDIVLTAAGVGTADRFVTLDTTGANRGTVTALAHGGVYLDAVRGDLGIHHIQTVGDIHLIGDGGIWNYGTNPSDGEAILLGRNVVLATRHGDIGTRDERIVVDATGIVNGAAYGDLFLHILDDLDSDYVTSETGWVNILVPQGEMQFWQLGAPRGVSLAGGGDITIEDMDTADFEALLMTPGRTLTIRNVALKKGLMARGDNVYIHNLLHSGTEPLEMTIVGLNGMADNVFVGAESGVGVVFEQLDADVAEIDVHTDDLRFADVLVGTRAVFDSAQFRVVADNVNRKLFASDLQIYPRSDRFYLELAAEREILTDAHVVNYDSDFIINEFHTENSFVRATLKYAQVLLSSLNEEPFLNDVPTWLTFPKSQGFGDPGRQSGLTKPVLWEGLPINTSGGSANEGTSTDDLSRRRVIDSDSEVLGVDIQGHPIAEGVNS